MEAHTAPPAEGKPILPPEDTGIGEIEKVLDEPVIRELEGATELKSIEVEVHGEGVGNEPKGDEMKKRPTMKKIDVIRAHMEETGGDADLLLAILKKSGYPDAKKQDIFNARYQIGKARSRRTPTTGPKPKAATESIVETPAPTASGAPFAARLAATIAKISEGLDELKALESEAGEVAELAERYKAAARIFGAK